MKQLEDGKTLNEETKHVETVEDWVRQYEATGSEDALEAQDLIEPITQGDEEYWNNLQKDWDELFSQERFQTENESFVQGFLSDYSKEYAFEESNPFKGTDNPFEEGLQKLKAGDLISAILLFEEAVTLNPSHAEAWQYLGTSQAENEQETLAIRALNKCIELQTDNATARMALAVSYTNESLQSQACNALKSWIQHHPRYSHLTTDGETSTEVNHGSSLMTTEMFNEVQHLYLSAARLAPAGDIDADIQVGLGVLFNISGDYPKAIDCFNTALQASPEDASVWNKLGATLANSGRSPEAIEAYRNALAIRPGFIRCRYNLGVSCINLKAYNEAIEHLLTALNMQRQGEDKNRAANTMSENIWTTLRMTLSLLGKLDLMKAVTDRDLKTLNEIFASGS